MLRALRDSHGGPGLRVRLLALIVVAGLVVLTAPVVLIPILRWLFNLVF